MNFENPRERRPQATGHFDEGYDERTIMNCSQFQDVVQDVARNAALDSAARRDALAHADSCVRCDELLANAQSLTGALRSLAASKATAQAPLRVEQALLREFSKEHAPARQPVWWPRWSAVGVASLAAAAILSLVVVKHVGLFHGTAGGPAGTSNSAITPGASIDAGATPVSANLSVAANEMTVDLADLDPNFAQNYVPLPIALDAPPAEDEAVVRVSVTPATLASYGLRINETSSTGSVVADFVVGEDGIPRAVRLVE
jgi:hypothetical protein